ncbi:hypothetical protein Bpfe_010773 [Biomphalaria pfeifferi]|uniref:Uncharacterized protein n=1 Tax=Biomphalaria pfeifferi TaxID=112525 RepID=A0AAD8FE63_BIOPF|nr:hypothetical protein Bpfe_010773 [Biomphalaria pfeifferi]
MFILQPVFIPQPMFILQPVFLTQLTDCDRLSEYLQFYLALSTEAEQFAGYIKTGPGTYSSAPQGLATSE